uniref:Zgc:92747 n=1 Tax=Danio rerio TaxID=7955 RepID=Q6DGW2_DANRE|nr:Zgc:92747 [Danio rerio]
MSGLNSSLGFFLAVVGLSVSGRLLLRRWTVLLELVSAFALCACRLEVDTIAEVGQWAGALGPDVAVTMLFLSIAVHTAVMQDVSGNPAVTLLRLLQRDVSVVVAVLSIAAQLIGAFLALEVAGRFWAMELSDMHMITNAEGPCALCGAHAHRLHREQLHIWICESGPGLRCDLHLSWTLVPGVFTGLLARTTHWCVSCSLPVFGKYPTAVQQESALLQEKSLPAAERKNQ